MRNRDATMEWKGKMMDKIWQNMVSKMEIVETDEWSLWGECKWKILVFSVRIRLIHRYNPLGIGSIKS